MPATTTDATLLTEIATMVVEAVGLDDVDPATIDPDAALFAAKDPGQVGLGLDSVDALEVVVALRRTYGIRMSDEDRVNLRTLRTLAQFVDTHS